ncbi:uncharacterized protein LOC122527561 [Frieseomelitta varia]|uniref:uncharacterized protein LOC122527561 n=1 Tax=Frieseomelitta varia TaxID=561572 RepID=UPI001CB69EE4|nr:uncharacterized protein LOC122527561 [Frieseomelitta varia]
MEEKSEQEQQKNETERSGLTKENWIKKVGNYSPHKCQVPTSPTRTNATKAVDRSGLCNTYEAITQQTTSGSSQAPLEEPDLEGIIREFEMGFLSPSKQDGATDGTSTKKNFVKKIVAAFEVKYKTVQATGESHEENKSHATIAEPSKKKSGIFCSPCKRKLEVSFEKLSPLKQNKNSDECGNSSMIFKIRSGIFDSPYKSEDKKVTDLSDISKDETKEEKGESSKESGIFSPSFNCNDSKNASSSVIHSSTMDFQRERSKDSSSDCSMLFKSDKEESDRAANFHFSSLDETKTIDFDRIDLDVTSPETVFVTDIALPKTSTMSNKFSKDKDDAMIQKISCKIVGAFLKKPIEVEDTSINWIPIVGKKLPRKRSLKKLFYSLTRRKFNEKEKLFCSEINLGEELREFQDSGYDEKSCANSSLTSLLSFTEVLLRQKNNHIESNKRSTLQTFKPKNKSVKKENEVSCNTNHSSGTQEKKLVLSEISREKLKQDLGPCYPSSNMMSLAREKDSSPSPVNESLTNLSKLPKHPCSSKIPKHPFVSLTKMDELEFCFNSYDSSSMIIKNDLYEVELRRNCDDLPSPSNFSSTVSDYDVPRTFFSENQLYQSTLKREEEPIYQNQLYQSTLKREEEPIYDVPMPQGIERPKSSIYENVVSLKRWNAEDNFKCHYFEPSFECHYSEPSNSKVSFNNKTLSLDDLTLGEKSTAF